MRLTQNCPYCDKILHLTDTLTIGNERLKFFKCGHIIVEPIVTKKFEELIFDSTTGDKHARDYQKEGIKFILNSDFNCIIGDQMRLGKTPQSLLALRNSYEERTPCLIAVRSANLWQWIREYKTWTDLTPLGIYPIIGSKGFIPPGFKTYIISMDTLSRNGMCERLKEIGFKLIIADEMHSFKNTDSKRSQALIDLLKALNYVDYSESTDSAGYHKQELTTKKNCGFIGLTGTAIKNRAEEYFVPLNICDPQNFSSLERFRRRWLMQDHKGRWSRVNPYAMENFKETIAPYVLRREKEDVYKDLPLLNRLWTVITIEDEHLKKAYNTALDNMERDISRGHTGFLALQDNLMVLRRICGLAKVDWLVDYLDVCLEDSPNERYAIGIHHHAVRDLLTQKLSQYGTLRLSGEDNSERKDWIMRRFATSTERVLIMNMLAGGIGMDFHYCNNVLILERQWSSADEEQFEFRFYNPDKSIKSDPTNVEYIVAKGTIDEWLYDLVESKRHISGETIGTNWSLSEDSGGFKELLERTVSSRL